MNRKDLAETKIQRFLFRITGGKPGTERQEVTGKETEP